MYLDPFTKNSIYDEHFWNSSRCLWHENTLLDFFRSMLINAGYSSTDDSNKVWQRHDRTVITCLVDDVFSCGRNYHSDFPYLYDKNTTVITDNHISCPTQFIVAKLPESFFGIYAHAPLNMEWLPDRDYTFAVHRLDNKRLEIFLELTKRTSLTQGYINFNCFQHDNLDSAQVFETQWQNLTDQKKQYYQSEYKKTHDLMPLRNYDFEHELAYFKSYLNVVIESYSSDHVIALSEKTFRALTTPVPWTLFSGRYSVAYLESLGFDVLHDLVDHNKYDRLIENQNKIDEFVWQGNKAIAQIKKMNFEQVRQRCQQAANHNQKLLADLRSQWPAEILAWMNNFSQILK